MPFEQDILSALDWVAVAKMLVRDCTARTETTLNHPQTVAGAGTSSGRSEPNCVGRNNIDDTDCTDLE